MSASADSIRRHVRAYAAWRGLLILLLPASLAPNVEAALVQAGALGPDRAGILQVVGLAVALALWFAYRARYGVIVPDPPATTWAKYPGYGLLGVMILVTMTVALVLVGSASPMSLRDLGLVLVSVGTLAMATTGRGAGRTSIALVLIASTWLVSSLAGAPSASARAMGHAAMALALLWETVQYHRFLTRGFRHART
jgi:hypothetical protein